MDLDDCHMHAHPVPPSPAPAASDSREYQTNEWTLVAWMRTGVALIGLGFVVARFGLVLRQAHERIVRSAPRPLDVSLSSWLDTVIVVLAAVLVALRRPAEENPMTMPAPLMEQWALCVVRKDERER